MPSQTPRRFLSTTSANPGNTLSTPKKLLASPSFTASPRAILSPLRKLNLGDQPEAPRSSNKLHLHQNHHRTGNNNGNPTNGSSDTGVGSGDQILPGYDVARRTPLGNSNHTTPIGRRPTAHIILTKSGRRIGTVSTPPSTSTVRVTGGAVVGVRGTGGNLLAAFLPSVTPTRHSPKGGIVKRGSSGVTAGEAANREWLRNGATPKKGKKVKAHYDRFIPDRSAMCLNSSQLNIARRESGKDQYLDSAHLAYQEEVARACGLALDKRILQFKSEPPTSENDEFRSTLSRPIRANPAAASLRRRILQTPERVLDAPGMIDDYYLNLLDWSCRNMVAVGLERSVYLWNAETGDVTSLCTSPTNEPIASLRWATDGVHLAIGTSEGDTQIWNVQNQGKVRSMHGHQARIGVLSWDKHIVSSGCRDGSIHHHDVRIAQHRVAELMAHSAEVCGLSWRPDGQQLASGGNDNLVNIWDARSSVPKFTKTDHKSAVKALAWCPWQTNLLASGGGSHDRHIHFWNTTTSARISSVDTGSQVTGLVWSKEHREILSSHGFPNHNISIWAYPSLTKVADIKAHDSRVLHTAVSPDGQTVATTASDENLKFWKCFESKSGKSREGRANRSRSRHASGGGSEPGSGSSSGASSLASSSSAARAGRQQRADAAAAAAWGNSASRMLR